MIEPAIDPQVLQRTLNRERRARAEAEALLESKTADLYLANEQLADLADSLAARERYTAAILEAAQEGVLALDDEGRVEAANPAAAELLGDSTERLHGLAIATRLTLNSGPHRSVSDFLTTLDSDRIHEGVLHTSDDRQVPVRLAVGHMKGDSSRRILVMHDLTAEQAAADALRRTAFEDALTGLGNRSALLEMCRTGNYGPNSAVIVLDLNRFTRVNYSLGRDVGDQALNLIATRLRDFDPASDEQLGGISHWFAARIGPDEFAVAIHGELDDDTLRGAAEAVQRLVGQPLELEGYSIPLECSIGYGRASASARPERQNSTPMENAIDRAVIAREVARNRVGTPVVAYETTMGDEPARILALEARIRDGLAHGEFQPFYQPRIDVRTGEIIAGEALARWDSPERGLLLPSAFLPIAEQSALVASLGSSIYDQVLQFQRGCLDAGIARPISVNVSNAEFALPSIVDRMTRQATDAGVPPELIEVELLETVIMDDLEYSARLLHQFSDAGFLVALDDFGTGQSSLGRLRSLPIDILKLDRSFVSAVPEDQQSAEILTAMVRLAEAIGATVVVEGVESQSQLDVVQAAGDCEVQGFYYSPAVGAASYRQLLRTQPWVPRT